MCHALWPYFPRLNQMDKKEILPERNIHSKKSVHRNSSQTQNRDEGQPDDNTADEETAMERRLHSSIDHYSQRYGHAADHEVSHSQSDNEAECGLLNAFGDQQ